MFGQVLVGKLPETVAVLGVAVSLISFGLAGLVRRYALRKQLLDPVGHRSSHARPTPRGGGVAIVGAFGLGFGVLTVGGLISPSLVAAVAGGGGAVALIGWVDDHGHVPARWRLLVHVLASSWAVGLLGDAALPELGLRGETAWMGGVLAVLGLVWWLNLYNFMDGIDGIASAEALFLAWAAAAPLLLRAGEPSLLLIFVVLGAAVLGFFAWNWPPARLFMGDVGSGFLGFALGVLGLAAVCSGALTLWSWLLVLGVFAVDATLTLGRRVLRGEQWYNAHRSHAYQHASRRWGHGPVTAGVMFINLVWLLPLAWAATLRPEAGPVLLIAAWIPLVSGALWLGAGREEHPVSPLEVRDGLVEAPSSSYPGGRGAGLPPGES